MLVYGACASATIWLGAIPWTLARGITGGLSPGELPERLGRTATLPPSRRSIVIHGVSAGEMAAARALVHAMVRLDPDVRILLTMGTRDGRTLAEGLREDVPQIVGCRYLPWDRPRAVRRWLAALQPRAVVVVETELWPGLFSACRALGIPLSVVSGRLYPKDVARYRWLGRWWSDVMAMPTRVLVQDEREAESFVAIGTPSALVQVGGNLKFDATGAAAPSRADATFTVVAGSTHAPEEAWILEAVSRLQHAGVPCALTLAPRDIRRAPAVRRQADALGVRDVTVLDRMGTLPAAYRSAHVALCGGTFTTMGGHNIIEPAAAGCAIVAGPHIAHIRGLVGALDAAGGMIQLPASGDPAAVIAATLMRLQGNRTEMMALGERAAAWRVAARGAANRAARAILSDRSSNTYS